MLIDGLERALKTRRQFILPAPALLERIQSEYREMPGLILTEAQAKRLWALDAHTCRAVLGALLERQFLRRTAAGTYLRTSE